MIDSELKEKIYVVWPGPVRSKHDGQIHTLSCLQLVDLYGIKGKPWVNGERPGARTVARGYKKSINLYPDPSGKYRIPA